MSSPSIVTFRSSDVDLDSYRGLDFLGFKLDMFLREVNEGGQVNSPYFHRISQFEQNELEKYINMKGLRLKSDPKGMFLVYVIYPVHEAPGKAVAHAMQNINMGIAGNFDIPLRCDGTASIPFLDGTNPSPDEQVRVNGRDHSPNFVLESHYRQGHNMADFHCRLKWVDCLVVCTSAEWSSPAHPQYQLWNRSSFSSRTCSVDRSDRWCGSHWCGCRRSAMQRRRHSRVPATAQTRLHAEHGHELSIGPPRAGPSCKCELQRRLVFGAAIC